MTTSGQTNYSPQAVKIFTDAMIDLAVINEDEALTPAQLQACFRKANGLIKNWEATGLHVWTEQEGILFLQKGQTRYLLGGASTDHFADAFGYQLTTTSANVAAAGAAVPLASTAGFAANQKVGIVMDTGEAFWTTVNGAPAGGAITLAAGVSGAVSAGAFVYSYTTDNVRPLQVPAARRLAFTGMVETPLGKLWSRREYMDQPNKTATGLTTAAFYNPARDQGEMFVWQSPPDANSALRFTWYRPLETFLTNTDTADMPDEWSLALEWNLAKEMGLGQSIPAERWKEITAMAAEKFELVSGYDREAQSIYFGRDNDGEI